MSMEVGSEEYRVEMKRILVELRNKKKAESVALKGGAVEEVEEKTETIFSPACIEGVYVNSSTSSTPPPFHPPHTDIFMVEKEDSEVVTSPSEEIDSEIELTNRIITYANYLITTHYGHDLPISKEGIQIEADMVSVRMGISKSEAIGYIKQAVALIQGR